MVEVLIGMGSNLGSRTLLVKKAISLVQRKLKVKRMSRFVVSAPSEGVTGGWFLNGVLLAETNLLPTELLCFLQKVEIKLGRPPDHLPGKARSIDLDILFYGDKVIRSKELTIPHIRVLERPFVLNPLLEIVPGWIHPLLKRRLIDIAKEKGLFLQRGNQ
ncbi:MAG: 2-amino-4-hydroxy-6-hydroxymethyldihydropteridine diphosphokinase [Candidatus Omnitrophica bacterium]|nr:2-amino-4-hydroxy-6-hydroxymethyldihydropteridine diphosphokinase [Candidatus Omnitrophota bacterium]